MITGMNLPSQTGSHAATVPTTTSAAPDSGADLVRSKMSYAALFGFGIVVAALV